jgi:hypothetical protein
VSRWREPSTVQPAGVVGMVGVLVRTRLQESRNGGGGIGGGAVVAGQSCVGVK